MRIRLRAALRAAAVLAVLGSTVVSPIAAVADERSDRAVATRQGALKLMGFYITPLGGMARGKLPMDAALVARNADRIAQLAPMLTDVFKADTSGSDSESGALPVIWTQPAAFQAKIETLVERAADLGRIAGAADADEGAIKGGIGKMGQACGSCHDDFRVKDD